MMVNNILRAVTVVAALACWSGAAKAATITYDLLLSGALPGTGVLSIAGPINASFQQYGANDPSILALSFSIGGFNFDLKSDPGASYNGIQFINGSLTNLTANDLLKSGIFNLASLQINGLTSVFFNFGTGVQVIDTLSATLRTASAVPLPAALPMFAGGLVALGLLARRRKKTAASIAA